MIPREIAHSLVAVYGWCKPVGDVLFTIGVIPREKVHSLVAVYGWCKPVGDICSLLV